MSERDGTDSDESTSRQDASTKVEELCGRTCERLLGVVVESSGELVNFYLRVEGIWFRGYIDVGVFFLAPAAPDPEDDLEVRGEYLDLGRVLGVEGASIQRFAMCEGVLRIEFEVGDPLVLWEEQGATRWGSAEGKPGPGSRHSGGTATPSRGFEVLRDRGATPLVACNVASAWGLGRIERIRMLRAVYGLSLRDAKEVMHVHDGSATSLDEHQAAIAAELEALLPEERRELLRVDSGPVGEPRRRGANAKTASTRLGDLPGGRLIETNFSRSEFTDLIEDRARDALCAELGAVLKRRMRQASEFHAEARACVRELRALGHDLWSFDEGDEFQAWCPNYETPTGPGIVVTFAAPGEVTVEWSAQ